MKNLVRVELVGLLPTQAGCAVFLGDGTKEIVFYIDPTIGASINAAMTGQAPPRPLSHDLFLMAMQAMGGKVARVILVRKEEDVFFARLIFEAENEIMQKKIVELDGRPSDCIALAVRTNAPIYVVRGLWESLDDMSATLRELRENSGNEEIS